MGIVVSFKARRHRRHGRASAGSRGSILREAKSANRSAVTPAALPVSDSVIGFHHSSGMRSRCSHFRADATDAPISAAIAPGDRQRPITARNESKVPLVEASSVITESAIGQFVLNGNAILSHDCGRSGGNNRPMAKDEGSTAHRDAFVARVKLARESRFRAQQDLCDVLKLDQGTYQKYEIRSYLPYPLVWRFCQACGVSLEWLVTGRGRAPVALQPPSESAHKGKRPGRKRAA